ncbi:Glycosyl hydrolases family 16 [Rhodococcus rhodochrous J3]|uniref:Ricin-type beta-trefoil lectin domain protein n=2 Tax=Rhodococcus rhodochrous TaxID=1829 RepID=A0AA46WZM2_RHORH|nr:ricin-type beta-trefoil lectin domain protein [Rhodococcus rhodochrous]TWH52945.1 Beta-glucanase/Beta-glucan synthetase [Rhodococcus rhodochrous J38]UZF46306.1 ricin-type beta-trefoil lectin domain protein [Rhodococcus rhodochrous]SMG31880.1 Glycosyl hydrolases family 16 [Rhodococcus rhodochrous J3]
MTSAMGVDSRRTSSRRRIRGLLAVLATAVVSVGATIVAAPVAQAYEIGPVRDSNGRCLDNKWGVTLDGNPAQVYTCNGSAAQSWSAEADNTVRVQGKCLMPAQGRMNNNTAVVISNCTGAANQKWVEGPGGTVRLQSNSTLCLENSNGANVDGNPVVVRTCNGSAAQRWQYGSPTVPPEPAPQPIVTSPSGVSAPRGNLDGWRQIFVDEFTRDAPVGSWANVCDPDRIVYTGAEGQKWRTYPSCYLDTYQRRPYRPDQVLSVGNGVMNFHLHPVDGMPAGANPSPLIDGVSQYQTYGRYSIRLKVDNPNLQEYYIASLLWPQSERWPVDGEFDFPEGGLAGTVSGFHHYAGGGSCPSCQIEAAYTGARFTDWHTYTMEWSPGRIRYLLDDQVVLDSTDWVPSTPMRWQIQVETNGYGANTGNLLVDWVSVYSYDPAARP